MYCQELAAQAISVRTVSARETNAAERLRKRRGECEGGRGGGREGGKEGGADLESVIRLCELIVNNGEVKEGSLFSCV
jgi:hypothetical protein